MYNIPLHKRVVLLWYHFQAQYFQAVDSDPPSLRLKWLIENAVGGFGGGVIGSLGGMGPKAMAGVVGLRRLV